MNEKIIILHSGKKNTFQTKMILPKAGLDVLGAGGGEYWQNKLSSTEGNWQVGKNGVSGAF